MIEGSSTQAMTKVLERLRNEHRIEVGILIGLEDAIRNPSVPSVLRDYDLLVLVGNKKAKILIVRGDSRASQKNQSSSSPQRLQHELKKALISLNSDLKQTSAELALERFAPKLEAIFLKQTESF